VRSIKVDAEQTMAVRPFAEAAAASLDTKQFIEELNHEVVMQKRIAVANDERKNRRAVSVMTAEDIDVRVLRP
jgi:hypothetical protein